MNFLGHLYLSGDEPLVIVGNFMADAVKGGRLEAFDPQVVRGIRLHRAIDSFTDIHPMHRTGRERVRTHAGRYAGVVMDLFFDHLLAERWSARHPEPLADYAQRMYALIQSHAQYLPDRTRSMLPHMVQGDWLTSYARIVSIGRALAGLARRVPGGEVMVGAEQVLADHLEQYHAEFDAFIADINAHTFPLR